jgi:hypothetical protein
LVCLAYLADRARLDDYSVLDEVHKYLTDNGASSRLTDSLLTIIRQQRHENIERRARTGDELVRMSVARDWVCGRVVTEANQSSTSSPLALVARIDGE